MTQLRWGILLLVFLFPTVTDLLFQEVSSAWLIGCTVLSLIWNLFCGFDILRLILCLVPGMLLWILSHLSRGIGIGDVLAVFLLGGVAGFQMSLEILFGGSIFCLVAQICLIIKEKMTQLWVQREREKFQRERLFALNLRKEKGRFQGECTTTEEKVKSKFQSEMPFVPWMLASIWINWILQVVFS